MSTYRTLVLAKRPTANIIPGETFHLVEGNTAPTESDLKDGEVLLETYYLSIDPGLRPWLDDVRSYTEPVAIGEVMRGFGLGKVRASNDANFPVNSYARGLIGWTELKVIRGEELQKVEVPQGAKVTDALGILGLTGLTAYFGMVDTGNVQKGDFVVISGAAGATGSVAGQIAKLKGARVLGLAGSDEKVRWLTQDLGFDDALNYKDKDFAQKFKEATKDLIDVFYDNVGGEILDLALLQAKPHSRFVMCGGVSQYNASDKRGQMNLLNVVQMRIRMQGFLVFDFVPEFPRALADLTQWLAQGKLQRRDTIVTGGLEMAASALADQANGANVGKMLVQVKSLDD